MKRTTLQFIVVGLLLSLMGTSGCRTKPMFLETQIDYIDVGINTSADVMKLFPEKGMLRSDTGISVQDKKIFSREITIVTFDKANSIVQRVDYFRRHTDVIYERFHLRLETLIPAELLNKPYENDFHRYLAILRYCHQALIEDSRPFLHDQPTSGQAALARTALSIGILKIQENPRQADDLVLPAGFKYDHPTLDNCSLQLRKESKNNYTVTIRSRALIDIFAPW